MDFTIKTGYRTPILTGVRGPQKDLPDVICVQNKMEMLSVIYEL